MPEITPGHPWRGKTSRILRRGELVKRGTIDPRRTWSKLGGHYTICEVAPEDGTGFIVQVIVVVGSIGRGEFTSATVLPADGHFETVKECVDWARAWARVGPPPPAAS